MFEVGTTLYSAVTTGLTMFKNIKEGVEQINNYLNEGRYKNIESLLAVRNIKDDKDLNEALDKLKKEGCSMSKEKLAAMHDEYKKAQGKFKNPSYESTALWELIESNDLNDKERAESILNFMFNKKNWGRRTCEILWGNYIKDTLFESATNEKGEDNRSKANSTLR